MSKPIGVTIHHEDKSTLKVPIGDLAAAVEALRQAYGGGGGRGGKYNRINADGCPLHGAWKAVPGGVSRKTGNSYNAFYTCTEDECLNRPTKAWEETHPIGNDASQVEPPQTGQPTEKAEDFDDLPF